MTPAVKVILIINLVFYVLAEWITPGFPLGGYSDWFKMFNTLYPWDSQAFIPYQYITYMFMHKGWWHLFFNMWSLMIFGNSVEQRLGTQRFCFYYLMCGIGSALVHQLCTWIGIIPPAGLVGASGALYGVMAAAAYFFPNERLFIIPIPFPIKLKYLVGFFAIVEMYLGITSIDDVAHFTHLGGMLVGILILLFWKWQEKRRVNHNVYNDWQSSHYDRDESVWNRVLHRRTPKMRVTKMKETTNSRADQSNYHRQKEDTEEIDRILDKIRKNGYQNLTDSEKATLFNASKHMRGEE